MKLFDRTFPRMTHKNREALVLWRFNQLSDWIRSYDRPRQLDRVAKARKLSKQFDKCSEDINEEQKKQFARRFEKEEKDYRDLRERAVRDLATLREHHLCPKSVEEFAAKKKVFNEKSKYPRNSEREFICAICQYLNEHSGTGFTIPRPHSVLKYIKSDILQYISSV